MGCERFTNLKLFRKPYKFKTVNILKYMNVHIALARRICKIVENTEAKMKYLENLKMNLSKYQYSKQLTEFGINKALVFLYKN